MLIEKSENMPCAASAIDGVRRLKLFIFCLLLCAISVPLSSTCLAATGNTYYLDAVNGNDAYDGTSATDDGGGVGPWGTMDRALPNYSGGGNVVGQGDTVYVASGDYGQVAYNENGDTGRSDWITYIGDTDDRPTFCNFDIRNTYNVYMKFYNFRVLESDQESDWKTVHIETNDTGNPVSYIQFHNCYFDGSMPSERVPDITSSYDTMHLNYVDEMRLEDCTFDGGMSGIKLNYAATNIAIVNCRLANQWNDAIDLYAVTATQSDILIDGVYIQGPTLQAGTGLWQHQDLIQTDNSTGEINNLTIRNSIFKCQYADAWYQYIDPDLELDPQPLKENDFNYECFMLQHDGTGLTIENNLAFGQTQGGGFTLNHTVDGVVIRNNTIATSVYNLERTCEINVTCTDVTFYNNIWHPRFKMLADPAEVSQGFNLFGDYQNKGGGNTGPTMDGDSLELGYAGIETLFTDFDNNDFTLAAGSTAIDFGDAAHDPDTDILGNSRVGLPDAGCYEYGASLGNLAPIADAGLAQPQTVIDVDSNGNEQVTLNGSASYDSDGIIVSWVWTDDHGAPIPDGEITTAILSVGTHSITLTVTDNNDLSATDTVTIIVDGEPKISSSKTPLKNEINIQFDRPLDKSLVEDPNNYTINYTVDAVEDSIVVHNVSSDPNLNMARLFTSAHSEDVEYILKADFIQDEVTYTSNLVGDWGFDEYSGLEAKDSSCKGNTATLVNGPAWTGLGDLSFDGNDDAVEISTAGLDAGQGTISLWAYAQEFSVKQYLFSHSTQGATSKIQLYVKAGRDRLCSVCKRCRKNKQFLLRSDISKYARLYWK